MQIYSLVLFVHVASALGMTASIGALAVCKRLMFSAESLRALRALASAADRTATATKTFALTLLTSGLALAPMRGSLDAPWVLAGLAILVWLAATGALVHQPSTHAAVEAASSAEADGTLRGDLRAFVRARLSTPLLEWLSATRLTLLVLVAFLMTVKPDGLVTTIGVVVALAAGSIVGLRRGAAPRTTSQVPATVDRLR